MNGDQVKKHLENFIASNDREVFGVSSIQRDCKVNYNNGKRVMDLGIKNGLFEYSELEPSRAIMVKDDVH